MTTFKVYLYKPRAYTIKGLLACVAIVRVLDLFMNVSKHRINFINEK